MMDQQIKSDWIEALRGDEYEQAKGAFTRVVDGKVRHCCLAVLADLACKAGAEGIRRAEDYDKSGMYEIRMSNGIWRKHHGGGFPSAVVRWANFSKMAANPLISGIAAISRNDQYWQTYTEIADAIERDKEL